MARRKNGTGRGLRGGAGERSEPETPRSPGHRGRPGRRSVAERKQAVLDLLAGKATVDQVARRFGVRAETVEGWRSLALEGIEGAFRQGSTQSARERELEQERRTLEKVVTRLTMQNELLQRALKEFPRRPGKSFR